MTGRTSRHRSNLSMPTKGDCRNYSRGAARRAHAPHRGAATTLFRQRIDSLGQTKIKLRQPAFAVRRDNQTDFVVTNIDVGVVFFFLGHFRDSIYEIYRVCKIIKLESALDMFLL